MKKRSWKKRKQRKKRRKGKGKRMGLNIGLSAQDVITLGWLLFAMIAATALQAIGVGRVSPLIPLIAYTGIASLGTTVTSLYVRELVNAYKYLEIIVRPENLRLHVFVKGWQIRKLAPKTWARRIQLAFPVNFKDYGKVDELEIIYKYSWDKRLDFTPGYAVFKGIVVKHPNTEIVEVYQLTRSEMSIDHGKPVPVLYLKSASQDCNIEALRAGGPLSGMYEALLGEINHLRQSRAAWQQKALALERIAEQLDNENTALLKAKDNLKKTSMEYLLTLNQAEQDIKGAIRQIRGEESKVFSISKWIVVAIVALSGMLLLYARPDLARELQEFLMTPFGIIAGIAVLISAVALTYVYVRRTRG